MNVTSIRLEGLYTVDLPLYVAKPSDPYLIKAADGLGPPGYDVGIAGTVFQGREPRNRELIFRVGLTPDYRLNQTAADLRDRLYGLLCPERADGSVLIHFMRGDEIVASTRGWVSDIEPALFTKEPEVNVTLPCAGAFLSAPNPIRFVPSQKGTWSIVNAGTAPSGIEIELMFAEPKPGITFNYDGKRLELQYNFLTGDILYIDTRENTRTVKVTRAGLETEIIYSFKRGSEWIQLHGGTNLFTMSHIAFTWNYVRYTPLYQGV